MKDTADPQIALQIRERSKKYDQAFNKNADRYRRALHEARFR